MNTKKTSSLQCNIELPEKFQWNEVLSFHRRDQQETAERVETDRLYKAMLWNGYPACLFVQFEKKLVHVVLNVDGEVPDDTTTLSEMVRHMLGLTQNIEEFEEIYRNHILLAPLIASNPGLRVPQTATPFEALTWAITGQQISVRAAVSIRRRLILAAGQKHSGGLMCYPDAGSVAAMTEAELCRCGYSQAKAGAMIALSRNIGDGLLPLEEWRHSLPVDEIRKKLIKIRGIGQWTVEYAMLRGFGFMDGSLHNDVAVRRNLQILLQKDEKITPEETGKWLAQFSPWRALVAAHLWAMQSIQL